MSEIVGLLRKTLASSCNYSERYFDEFSQCAREFYASRQGSPAHQAVFSAFRSTRGSDVQTVVRAVGEAIVTALNGRQLRIPFFAAWENTWRFEGGTVTSPMGNG